ncbi:MAG: glycosyltransferase, partial [Bradyrhizobium sp.]
MRVLHFMDAYLPHIGGTETLVRSLCEVQRARGHAVAVSAGAVPGHEGQGLIEGKDLIEGGNGLIDGVPVFRRKGLDQDLAKRPDLFLRLVADAAAIKRQWAPDVVHCHACGVSGWINLLTGKSYPNVVTLHSSTLRLPRGIQERMLVEAACVTAVSISMRGGFAEQAANRKT